jgi:Zn-dependent peptidase ImmA (M78 family)
MDAEAEGREAAQRFRDEQHLGVQPLGDLVALIEQVTGYDVAVLEAGPDEHGLTMRDPERDAVFIGVARTPNPMRQRSTLAHELGHVLFRDWVGNRDGNWTCDGQVESRATAFARHLLVPVEGLREFVGTTSSVTESTLSGVVQYYLVSPAIAAIALYQAEYIDTETKTEWKNGLTTPQLAARFGWSDHYEALQSDSDQRRAPQRLLARAIRGYEESVLSAQAIATLRGITPEAAEDSLREAGVVPVQRDIKWGRPSDLPEVDVDLAALDALDQAAGDDPPASERGVG